MSIIKLKMNRSEYREAEHSEIIINVLDVYH